MGTIDRFVIRFVYLAMGVFGLLGVGFLVASLLSGFDVEFLLMGLGGFAWIGLLGLAFQPWNAR